MTTAKARFDDATGTGPLQGPGGSQPASRDTCTAFYPDPVGRLRFAADYGTNSGAALTRPAVHPSPSDTVLVSEQIYAADGGVLARIAPDGTITLQKRDAARRDSETVEDAPA